MLRIERSDLDAAAAAEVISRSQVESLWQFLLARAPQAGSQPVAAPRFDLTHVLYYLGGMLAIGAMSVFMTLGWERYGGGAIVALACAYGLLALGLALWFERRALAIPMGLMAALLVVLVPLGVWGAQHALGFWADSATIRGYRDYHVLIDWRWITLEGATLLAAAVVFYRFRAPFLLLPVAVTLWYMSMDVAAMLLGADAVPWSDSAWAFRKWFSLVFGLGMLAGAFWVDVRSRSGRDYAFWLYVFGLLTFWGALTSMSSDRLAGKLVYLSINLGLLFLGALLARRAFAVFAGIGIALVLGDLAWRYFKDSWAFPIALSAIGLVIVFAGLWWSRHAHRLTAQLQEHLPVPLRELLRRRQSHGHGG
jgi:hypothetical protein